MMAGPIRPIRTDDDHDAALARIAELMEIIPLSDAPSALEDELEVLALLVERYEDAQDPIARPDPLEAIRFRMEQQGLTLRDLAPFLGSRGKVSEVLSGKRPLTLRMIRALHENLGIPAEVLIQEPGAALPSGGEDVEWDRFPLLDMAKARWIERKPDLKDRAEEIMRALIERAGGFGAAPALYRKSTSGRRNAKMKPYALQAWCLQVLAEAREVPVKTPAVPSEVTPTFLRDIAKLSTFTEGPRLAQEHLRRHGIVLVTVPHLPNTYLDGAAMRTKEGVPVVAMTLRYDRPDNFWFCLLHELAHIRLHMDGPEETTFIDDLSLRRSDHDDDDEKEREADNMAEEALIPHEIWQAHHPLPAHPLASDVEAIARDAGVAESIVAGRIRFEKQNYRLLSQFIGHGEVRKHFEGMAA